MSLPPTALNPHPRPSSLDDAIRETVAAAIAAAGLGQNRVLSVEEAAEYLAIDPQAVRRAARNGEIPAKKIGRHWRISRQALDQHLAGVPAQHEAPSQ